MSMLPLLRNNLRDVVLTGDTEQRFADIGAGRRNHFRAELAREREITSET
jgi:hypothetical protein